MEKDLSAYTSELSIDALRQNAFLQSDFETLERLAAEARQFAFNSHRAGDAASEIRFIAIAEGCEADLQRLNEGVL